MLLSGVRGRKIWHICFINNNSADEETEISAEFVSFSFVEDPPFLILD